MLIDQGMDTGMILRQKSLAIASDATTPSLTDELIALSHTLLAEDIPEYLSGSLSPRSQPHPDRATYSRKLSKEDGLIDWSKSAEVLEREIRAFADWPKSYTKLGGIDLVVTKAAVTDDTGVPGMHKIRDKELLVYCGSGALNLKELKPAGKNVMSSEAFLAGYKDRLA
jgi:methionyl-tRNA formyltransferase